MTYFDDDGDNSDRSRVMFSPFLQEKCDTKNLPQSFFGTFGIAVVQATLIGPTAPHFHQLILIEAIFSLQFMLVQMRIR